MAKLASLPQEILRIILSYHVIGTCGESADSSRKEKTRISINQEIKFMTNFQSISSIINSKLKEYFDDFWSGIFEQYCIDEEEKQDPKFRIMKEKLVEMDELKRKILLIRYIAPIMIKHEKIRKTFRDYLRIVVFGDEAVG